MKRVLRPSKCILFLLSLMLLLPLHQGLLSGEVEQRVFHL